MFAVLIVPGLLLLGGYQRTRAHSVPTRDLYALAQAIAISLAWLPVIWLLGGHSMLGWLHDGSADSHQAQILVIVLLNLAVALTAGFVAGRIVDWIGGLPDSAPARWLAWTGIFEPPTAWDAAWRQATGAQWAAVEVRLKGGDEFNVLFDEGSTVGLSPAPRQLFFDTEYDWNANGEISIFNHDGIYIDADDIVSLRFQFITE